MKPHIALIMFLFFSQLALANSNVYFSTSYGLYKDNGPVSCGAFISDDANHYQKESWKSWISGYMSASNWLRSRETTEFDINSMYFWILNYCKQNPLKQLITGVGMLDRELGRGKYPVIDDKYTKK